jgi:DNA invertase Pin-like site-specific DNA recombinase
MSRSERVTAHPLARKALIEIRPSTPPQVVTTQESLPLPYALRPRTRQLGWHEADSAVIEADLGLTAVTAEHRSGFKDLVTQVTLSQVGILLSRAVTRLSRTLTGGCPLLDICGYQGCLIAERDGVYDPATPNGRRLLGLKGTWSELARPTIRAHLTAGLLHQAERGELALALPMGLGRDQFGPGQKTPDLAVQPRLELLFATLLRVHTARTV